MLLFDYFMVVLPNGVSGAACNRDNNRKTHAHTLLKERPLRERQGKVMNLNDD